MNLYKNIANKYNERYSANDFDYIGNYLSLKIQSVGKVLDLGCGTFHWGNTLKSNIFGVDASLQMLKHSKIKGKIVNGYAEYLPFASNIFDIVFIVHAFHHFENKEEAATEIYRVLKIKGKVIILFADFHNPDFSWYVYDFFPNIFKQDSKRFLSQKDVKHLFAKVGFTDIVVEYVFTTKKNFVGNDVFNDKFLEKHNTSQLASLTEDEYNEGIYKIKKIIKQNPEYEFPVNIPVYAFIAEK